MSAPDPKAVEGAIAKLARDGGCDCADCRARVTLIAAARAYLRAPTAPQGAEPVADFIARQRPFSPEVSDALAQPRGAYMDAGAPQGAEIARENALRELVLTVGNYMQ